MALMNDSKKIFLLTDNEVLTTQIVTSCALLGNHEVLEERDARHAVRAMWAFRPDLVMLDLDSAWAGGDEMPIRLRGEAALSGIPVILISASRARIGVLDRRERFVPKPVKALEFVFALRSLIAPRPNPNFAAATQRGAQTPQARPILQFRAA